MPDLEPLPWIPILMYHRVVPESTQPDRFGNCVTVRAFRSHLRWLRRLNYTSVSLDLIADLAEDPERAPSLPRRPVAITFDDGYRDNHDYAWPLLTEHGFKATIFVVSSAIGAENDFDRANISDRVPMLSAMQIQNMHRGGIVFGSHTCTHPHDLAELPLTVAEGEIRSSRSHIENVVQAPVRHFSYPYARFHPRLETLVREAGYRSASAGVGTTFQPFRLSRVFASQRHGPGLIAQIGRRRSMHLTRRMAPWAFREFADLGIVR